MQEEDINFEFQDALEEAEGIPQWPSGDPTTTKSRLKFSDDSDDSEGSGRRGDVEGSEDLEGSEDFEGSEDVEGSGDQPRRFDSGQLFRPSMS